MNLSTARSEKRAKEVGMRKVIGAAKGSLVGQFLGESLMMCGLALVLTAIMLQMLLPLFNQLTSKDLSLVNSPIAAILLITFPVLTSLFAGLYPAFYLSSFKPISILKGRTNNGLSVINIRRGLVIFQFTISTILILVALIINQQLTYMSNLSLGFDKDQKIVLPIQTSEANINTNVLRNKLLESSQIITTAKGVTYPGIESVTSMLFRAEGKTANENVEIRTIYASPGTWKLWTLNSWQVEDSLRNLSMMKIP
jgi:putative ABC transport system permease protein